MRRTRQKGKAAGRSVPLTPVRDPLRPRLPMKPNSLSATHLLALALVLAPAALAAQAQEPTVSTRADTRDVSLTVYNGDYAVVRERRDVVLRPGRNAVRYEDVAQQIEAQTVSLKSLTDPGAVAVREQNYQYDLVSPQAILEKSLGREVVLRRYQNEVLRGTLVSLPSAGGMVLRMPDGRLLLNPHGEMEVAEIPAGLISRPSLLWLLDAGRGGTHRTEVSYMTRGLDWSADYVAVASEAEDRVDLTGWVTLTNKSGARYADAQLQLMAGDVRRVTPMLQGRVAGMQLDALVASAAPAPQFAQEAFFEYHLYTLEGRTTLAENETKQMTLLSARNAGVRRRLVFDSRRAWGWELRPGQGSATHEVKAAVMLELENARANGMGMPLPAGIVRLYKADARGNVQFLGEDRIGHTPRDETVRLYVGDAFDVVATRRVLETRHIDDHTAEVRVEVHVRNRKETPAEVAVVERIWGSWRLRESSHPHERLDAGTAEFTLNLAPGAEAKVSYLARITW